MRKFFTSIISLIAIFLLVACTGKKETSTKINEEEVIPTFYFHGWSGTANSTNSMIDYAEKNSGAKKVITAKVDPDGKVKLSGKWKDGVEKPIIQVVIEDNRNADFSLVAKWYSTVIEAVKKEHDFARFNSVAHSMGNNVLSYYLIEDANESSPTLVKEVGIAAPLNGSKGYDYDNEGRGVTADGKPAFKENESYQYMFENREKMVNPELQILNIYGDLDDGSKSDGSVDIDSSQSFKYLVNGNVKSYQEKEFKGENAQHSKLHENKDVDKIVTEFLW